MAEYSEDLENLVPFEIGIQAGETVLMWVLGAVFWLLALVFMGMAVGWNFDALGIVTFVLGGIMILGSQFVTRYNPITTTRIPVTGMILWIWAMVLTFIILLKGWMVYVDTNTILFIIGFLVIGILVSTGLFLANFLTSLRILNWMSFDMSSLFFVSGMLSILTGITSIGFNNNDLIWIDKLSIADWTWLFLFAVSFLFMLELNDGAHRFNDIIRYAKKRTTGEFSLTPVINNYYIMGFILMLIIGVAILVVLLLNFFIRWITPFFSEQLAQSVMMNSVYSVFFTLIMVFVPVWIVLILWTEYKARKEEQAEKDTRKQVQQTKVGA